MRAVRILLIGAIVIGAGCRGNRTEDVRPVSAPIPPSASTAEILPLDQVRDPEVAVQHDRLLRPEARDRDHAPHAGRDLRPQLLQSVERTRPDDLVDLLRDRGADVGDLQHLLAVHVG